LYVDQVAIDREVELDVEPGRGVGAHLEVDSEGTWNVSFTCDTELSGYVCGFDLVASVEPPFEIARVRERDFEFDDLWLRHDAGAMQLLLYTAYDVDGISFRVDPDVPLRIDLLLDGVPAPEVVAWSSGTSVRVGAPTMPVEFVAR
jgi:hypothetical protein